MLDLNDVVRMTGLWKSTIKRRVQDGGFPKPQRTSVRRIGWLAADVKVWRAQLIEQGRR